MRMEVLKALLGMNAPDTGSGGWQWQELLVAVWLLEAMCGSKGFTQRIASPLAQQRHSHFTDEDTEARSSQSPGILSQDLALPLGSQARYLSSLPMELVLEEGMAE